MLSRNPYIEKYLIQLDSPNELVRKSAVVNLKEIHTNSEIINIIREFIYVVGFDEETTDEWLLQYKNSTIDELIYDFNKNILENNLNWENIIKKYKNDIKLKYH